MSKLIRVRKANKALVVDSNTKDSYLKQGFDVVDDKGKVIERATGGRMVSLPEHYKAIDEAVKEALAKSDDAKALEALKKENATLKAKVTKLENEKK